MAVVSRRGELLDEAAESFELWRAGRMTLTAAERLRGWCVFSCPRHGDLVATVPNVRVVCRCGCQAMVGLTTPERVRALRAAGLVPPAIADALQLSDARVSRLLREVA